MSLSVSDCANGAGNSAAGAGSGCVSGPGDTAAGADGAGELSVCADASGLLQRGSSDGAAADAEAPRARRAASVVAPEAAELAALAALPALAAAFAWAVAAALLWPPPLLGFGRRLSIGFAFASALSSASAGDAATSAAPFSGGPAAASAACSGEGLAFPQGGIVNRPRRASGGVIAPDAHARANRALVHVRLVRRLGLFQRLGIFQPHRHITAVRQISYVACLPW